MQNRKINKEEENRTTNLQNKSYITNKTQLRVNEMENMLLLNVKHVKISVVGTFYV